MQIASSHTKKSQSFWHKKENSLLEKQIYRQLKSRPEKAVVRQIFFYQSLDPYDGLCFARLETLARETGFAKETVEKALSRLAKKGVVEKIYEYPDGYKRLHLKADRAYFTQKLGGSWVEIKVQQKQELKPKTYAEHTPSVRHDTKREPSIPIPNSKSFISNTTNIVSARADTSYDDQRDKPFLYLESLKREKEHEARKAQLMDVVVDIKPVKTAWEPPPGLAKHLLPPQAYWSDPARCEKHVAFLKKYYLKGVSRAG